MAAKAVAPERICPIIRKESYMANLNPKDDKSAWMRYTALGTQILAFLAVGVFGGLKLDEWLGVSPLFIITLPAIALVGVLVQLYRQLTK